MKERISEGNDFIIERESRRFGSVPVEVFKINGSTGEITAGGLVLGVDPAARTLAETALDRTALVYYLSQDLPDADALIDGLYGEYVVRTVDGVGTYTSPHTVTLDDSIAENRQELIIFTERVIAPSVQMTVVNGGPGAGTLLVFDVTQPWKAVFLFDGTNWFLDRQSRMAF